MTSIIRCESLKLTHSHTHARLLTLNGNKVLVIDSDEPDKAFVGVAAMFSTGLDPGEGKTFSGEGFAAGGGTGLKLRVHNDAEVISIKATELQILALHNHPGAVQLSERFGSLMYERTGKFADHFRGQGNDKYLALHQKLLRRYALDYHSLGKTGKLEIQATKQLGSADALSVAYSPGVAEPCLSIKNNPDTSYDYTSRGHLVGVVSNGTAVLGLGNIGALASKPVMEGKAVLFKKFGLVDSFDIEINQDDPEKLIEMIVALEPTFGGINLEDIKAPECFYIEPECQRRMNIPVMHDDQHGTAIIAGAGLVNALEIGGVSHERVTFTRRFGLFF